MNDNAISEALLVSSPYNQEEAQRIASRIDRFYKRLAKDFGKERFHFNVSNFNCIIHDKGVLTRNDGHEDAMRLALANVFSSFVDDFAKESKLTREVALLHLVTELGKDVRILWNTI
jgi:hypothetical protein